MGVIEGFTSPQSAPVWKYQKYAPDSKASPPKSAFEIGS